MRYVACKIETDRPWSAVALQTLLLADVLVPKLRMLFDELRHQRDAAWILHHFDSDATRSQDRPWSAAACRRFIDGSLLPAAAASCGHESGAKAPHSKGSYSPMSSFQS